MRVYIIFFYTWLFVFGVLECACTNKDSPFRLITVLYNEKKLERIYEYIICLERNLAHKSIDKIHVLYDVSKDDGECVLLAYLKTKPIEICYISGRPTYGDCFKIANERYPNCRVIVSNADIYFNETLELLRTYDLTNKFLSLTRWNITRAGTLVQLIRPNGSHIDNSQDVWIFETPIRKFPKDDIHLGVMGCDRSIAYQAKCAGLKILNPCFDIQCCHLHLSGIINYDPADILPKESSVRTPFSSLM